MSIKNLIRSSLLSLKANKLRVFLTMIGIIIGISSVVVVLSIGDGLKANVSEATGKVNANKLSVNFYPENFNQDISSLETFTDRDIYDLKKVDGVEKVEKPEGGEESSGFGGFNFTDISFLGKTTTSSYDAYDRESSSLFSTKNSDKVAYGRYFEKSDINNDVIVLTYENAKKLFDDPKSSIGKAIKLKGTTFEVIGVLEKQESVFGINQDFIQQSSIDRINDIKNKENVNKITSLDVFISPGYDFDTVSDNIKEVLENNHPNLPGTYNVESPGSGTEELNSMISAITMFITLITAISLFVGGIGVMNIMYVSVTERKREIGIRRAIGATPNSIMLQFLFEAMFVTLIGGLLGILIGFILSQLAGLAMPFKPVVTIKTFIGASSTSIIVGIVFGMIPAYKASRLDPIKAIYN
ncbi:ABC transporter permease [Paraclostridium ghonii]|uniref:ABC transport system permease protein n=1 Tax=Paraclostridium ghonii TaxID=29358 RepID=A0ABU0N1R9_9FIRM|nr:ABC transporter permease [Paeniclostridium ghonii]MDQ0557114.1 putative ABC transport system permease protein [Paeniclostridium ghonii]